MCVFVTVVVNALVGLVLGLLSTFWSGGSGYGVWLGDLVMGSGYGDLVGVWLMSKALFKVCVRLWSKRWCSCLCTQCWLSVC